MTGEFPRDGDRDGASPVGGGGAESFVEAVVTQLSRALDGAGPGTQQQLDGLAGQLTSFLLACERGSADSAVQVLLAEPLLLSTVFQNVDLLYAHDYPHADAVGLATVDAVHRAAEEEES